MLHRKTIALAVGLACLTMSATAFAQQSSAPVLEAKAAETLPEVRVTATVDDSSESTRSYAAHAVTVGSKIPQTLRETPYSISVVTRQRLDDQNITKIEDVLKQTTGVNVTRFDGAGNFNTIQARGFDIGSIQLDGLAISQGSNYSTAMDTVIYDRIEVLRGPAGLLQGASEPGGTINLVRKHARADFAGSVAATLGSWDSKRAEFDLTGKLVESGAIRARVVGAVDDRDSFVDVLKTKKTIIYGTVEFDLSSSTTLSVGATQQKINSVLDQGLPTYANGALIDLSRSTFAGRDTNDQDMNANDMFAELEHRLDGGGLLKFSARQVDRWMRYRGARAASAITPSGDTTLQGSGFQQEAKNQNLDAYYTSPFELGGRTHRLLIGANYSTEDSKSISTSAAAGTLNLFNPNYSVALPSLPLGAYNSVTEQEQKGIYGQVQLKPFDRWTFLLGGRFSWWKTQTSNPITGVAAAESDPGRQFTPLVGAIFELTNNSSLYASYAETFVGQTQTPVNLNEPLPPRTGSQMELGIKSEFLDKRVNTSLAVFQVIDKDRAIQSSPGATTFVAGGEIQSQGFEAEINGLLSRGWDLTAGYAYTDMKYLKAPVTQGGSFAPKHSVNLWTKYTWLDGIFNRLSVAGGLKTVSDIYAQQTGFQINAGGYTIVNGQIGYQISDSTSLSLTVNNLFDKKYYEKISGVTRQNFYGEPRNVSLSMRTNF